MQSNSEKFYEYMLGSSIYPEVSSIETNKFVRWGKNKRYWYIFNDTYGAFGDWTNGISLKWSIYYDKSIKHTKDQKEKHLKDKEATEKQKEEICLKAKQAANSIIEKASQATEENVYLKLKGIKPHKLLELKNTLVVPAYNVDGDITTLQYIYENRKSFLQGGKKSGSFYIFGSLEEANKNDNVYLCEGISTGASIYEASGCVTICAFDAGNLLPVCDAINHKLRNFKVVVAADNDQWKDNNTGIIEANKVASKYGYGISYPNFEGFLGIKPTDFNDLHQQAGLEEVKNQLSIIGNNSKLPDGFILKNDGVYYEDNPNRIVSPIKIEAHTQDDNDENHGLLLSWVSPRTKKFHKWCMPMHMLAGETQDLRARLLNNGLIVSSTKKERDLFAKLLTDVVPKYGFTSVDKAGWAKGMIGKCFILPQQTFPSNADIVLSDKHFHNKASTQGTLDEWKRYIGDIAVKHSRLTFALGVAFASPLLDIINTEGGGFHFVSISSKGKSTALSVASSVYGSGSGGGYMKQWRTTSNTLETIAESHNNCLLAMDEIGVASKDVGESVYMLSNELGKARSNSDMSSKHIFQWKLLFLSTGEVTLHDKLREAGKEITGGQEVRLINISASSVNGILDKLEPDEKAVDVINGFKENTCKYYGTPIVKFLNFITDETNDLEQIRETLNRNIDSFVEENKTADTSTQVLRVLKRFGVVFSAIDLARAIGIIDAESSQLKKHIETCFLDWLSDRGSQKDSEEDKLINQVKEFFQYHQNSRFQEIVKGSDSYDKVKVKEEKINNQAGFKMKDEDGDYTFYVPAAIHSKEIIKGFNVRFANSILLKHGYLQILKNGKGYKKKYSPITDKFKDHYFYTSKVLDIVKKSADVAPNNLSDFI